MVDFGHKTLPSTMLGNGIDWFGKRSKTSASIQLPGYRWLVQGLGRVKDIQESSKILSGLVISTIQRTKYGGWINEIKISPGPWCDNWSARSFQHVRFVSDTHNWLWSWIRQLYVGAVWSLARYRDPEDTSKVKIGSVISKVFLGS